MECLHSSIRNRYVLRMAFMKTRDPFHQSLTFACVPAHRRGCWSSLAAIRGIGCAAEECESFARSRRI